MANIGKESLQNKNKPKPFFVFTARSTTNSGMQTMAAHRIAPIVRITNVSHRMSYVFGNKFYFTFL